MAEWQEGVRNVLGAFGMVEKVVVLSDGLILAVVEARLVDTAVLKGAESMLGEMGLEMVTFQIVPRDEHHLAIRMMAALSSSVPK